MSAIISIRLQAVIETEGSYYGSTTNEAIISTSKVEDHGSGGIDQLFSVFDTLSDQLKHRLNEQIG